MPQQGMSQVPASALMLRDPMVDHLPLERQDAT
jgi:hypothetical protein